MSLLPRPFRVTRSRKDTRDTRTLDLAPLDGVPLPFAAGRSLSPDAGGPEERDAVHATLIEKRASDADASPSGRYVRGEMIRTGRWKLALYTGDQGELYDLANDPGETMNHFDDPACSAVRFGLTERLSTHLMATSRAPTLWGANHFPG